MSNTISNKFPTIESNLYRLAIVGDAPTYEDAESRDYNGRPTPQPFCNSAGKFLRAVVDQSNLSVDQCFLGHVCQVVDYDLDDPDGFYDTQVQAGLAQLISDLNSYQPNCILLLGKAAFRAFRPDLCYEPKRKSKNVKYTIPLDNWRGSITLATYGVNTKVVATYHPSTILRNYKDNPYFKWDVKRAIRESKSKILPTLERRIISRPSFDEAITYFQDVIDNLRPVSTDIEGYCDNVGVTMVSFSWNPTAALVVPFWIDGGNYWSEEEETQIWLKIQEVYLHPSIVKKAHNGFYELFVLGYRHQIHIRNLAEDTMLKAFELHPQIEKGLGVVVSLYTNEPYYKDDRESNNTEVKLVYNGKDSACTQEIDGAMNLALTKVPDSEAHYRFNINLIPAFHYMHLRGCKFDMQRALAHKETATNELQPLLDRLESESGRRINPKSTLDKQWLLYDFLGYKVSARWGRSTKEEIILRHWAKDRNPLLRTLVRAINLRTRISDIGKLTVNDDGRIRTTYDLAGAGTARLSSRESIAMYAYLTKSGLIKWEYTGTNLQNQTKDLRDCLLPDSEDFDFWQFDLSGADAWTVGADLSALGNDTMLEDLKHGIKPSKVLLLMLQYLRTGQNPALVNKLDRVELKKLSKPLGTDLDTFSYGQGLKPDELYLCMKRVQHGTNYVAQPETVSNTIFKDTDGYIDLPPTEAKVYQSLYKLRYSVDSRTEWLRRVLTKTSTIKTAIGFTVQFFAIRHGGIVEDEIIRQAAALEPQAVTTGVTNRALAALWYDASNRRKDGSLFVEPLIQIHDALAGQHSSKLRSWARDKFAGWFNNPLIIHGIEVTIPAEGLYGPDWKNTKTPYV